MQRAHLKTALPKKQREFIQFMQPHNQPWPEPSIVSFSKSSPFERLLLVTTETRE